MDKKGFLVIAGGNVGYSKDEIYDAFLQRAGGAQAKICVVVVSSAIPLESYSSTCSTFVRLGAKPENISCLPLTLIPNLIAQGWVNDGDNPQLLPYLQDVSGVWFVGGDQIKTTKTLLRKYKTDTEALKLIKAVYFNGGVIGGTSAGASIMGKYMIGAGNDVGALTLPIEYDVDKFKEQNEDLLGQLLLTRGFDLFSRGLIDQHFNTRTRLQRVLTAMDALDVNKAFGISEDTGMIYDSQEETVTVLGSAYVCYITNCRKGKRLAYYHRGEKIKI